MSHVRILRLRSGTVRWHVKVTRNLKLVKTRKTGFHILSLKALLVSVIWSRNAWIHPAWQAVSTQQRTTSSTSAKGSKIPGCTWPTPPHSTQSGDQLHPTAQESGTLTSLPLLLTRRWWVDHSQLQGFLTLKAMSFIPIKIRFTSDRQQTVA